MREGIYLEIVRRLTGGVDPLVKHVDLWNRNVEFIEKETPWERPAVFVEFGPQEWERVKGGREYRCSPLVRLHVVTDSLPTSSKDGELDAALSARLEMSKRIHAALAGMAGNGWGRFDLMESHTNHDHEEIVEDIEVYGYVGVRTLE